MRRALLVTGVVVLLLGGLLIAGGYAFNVPRSTAATTTAGVAWGFRPDGLTQMLAKVEWSGGNSQSLVYLVKNNYAPFGFSCGGGGQLVASGGGPSGTISGMVTPGFDYLIYGCTGSNPAPLNFTLTLSGGITLPEVLGLVILIPGAVLVLIGWRSPTANPAEVERILGPRPPP